MSESRNRKSRRSLWWWGVLCCLLSPALLAAGTPDGAAWLSRTQSQDGSWGRSLDIEATSWGVLVLEKSGADVSADRQALLAQKATQAPDLALIYLATGSSAIATKLDALQQADGSWGDVATTALVVAGGGANGKARAVNYLLQQQNPDTGGWGLGEESSADITALVLWSLVRSGIAPDDARIAPALAYFENGQAIKSEAGGTIGAGYVLLALKSLGQSEKEITRAAVFLQESRRSGGGWAIPPDTVTNLYATGVAACALLTFDPADADAKIGVDYLKAKRDPSGGWYNDALALRNTSVSANALTRTGLEAPAQSKAAQWLAAHTTANNDALSRKIESVALSGMDANALVASLAQKQNQDGGFGLSASYASDTLDTLLAVRAFAAGNSAGDPAIGDRAASAVSFLLGSQNDDGSWGAVPGEAGDLALTAQVVSALTDSLGKIGVNPDFINNAVKKASLWLTPQQNADGGFGAPESAVAESALSYSALLRGVQPTTLNAALDFVKGKQDAEGSWNASPFDTALSLFALQDQAKPPVSLADLAVFPSDVVFSPAAPSPNRDVDWSITVRNVGGLDADGVVLWVYNGDPAAGGALIGEEQRIAHIGAGESAVARFTTRFPTTGFFDIYVLVDPNNTLPEANEGNNRAVVSLTVVNPSGQPDFVVLPSDLSFQPAAPKAGEPVQISAIVHNAGNYDAEGVTLRFYDGDPAAGGVPLGPDFLFPLVPSGGRVTAQLTAALTAGQHSVFAVADPDNKFGEPDKANNASTVLIAVGASAVTLADLSLSAPALSNTAPKAGEPFDIDITLSNKGGTDAKAFAVRFFDGDPAAGGASLGKDFLIPNLDAGASAKLTLQSVSLLQGDHTLYVVADAYKQVPESNEANNTATRAVTVAANPQLLADLRIDTLVEETSPVIENQPVQLKVEVQNYGRTDAANVLVQVYDGDPTQGAPVIAEHIFPTVPARTRLGVSLTWTPVGVYNHEIWGWVDPFGSVSESSETNNQKRNAIRVVKAPLPAADLSVSESEIVFSNPAPKPGETITITAYVSNAVNVQDTAGVAVRFYDGDPATGGTQVGADVTGNVNAGQSVPFSVSWDTTGKEGDHEIFVRIDPDNLIPEQDKTNNEASAKMHIGNLPPKLFWAGQFGFTDTGVYPKSGNPATVFEFRVMHTDPNGDAPLVDGADPTKNMPRVWIDINGDGEYKDTIDGFVEGPYSMEQTDAGDTNYADGKVYVFRHTLPIGRKSTYRFETQDASGLAATEDPTVVGVNAGPTVLDKPFVNVMPTYPAWPGKGENIVWGNVKWAGVSSGRYRWDFGDGSPAVEGIVKDNPDETAGERSPRFIWLRHEYTTLNTYTATLTVTDDSGLSDSDQVQIVVQPVSTDARAKAGVEDGLRWLYLQQEGSGRWNQGTYWGSPVFTAFATLSFENNGHFASSNLERDIYADTVRNGINWLLNNKAKAGLTGENAVYDQNQNGYGYYWSYHSSVYETGMVLMALAANTEERSPAYAAIIQDVVDLLIYAQYRDGGWRYGWHGSGSDNSVSQWAVLGIEAATGCAFNAKVPSWVLDASNPQDPFGYGLRHWLEACQSKDASGNFDDGGGFGYGPSGVYHNMNASGLNQLFLAGYEGSSDRVQAALNWQNSNWTVDSVNGWGFYYQYALGKSLRFYSVDRIGTHLWYDEMVDFLLSDTDRDRRVRDRRWYDNSPTSSVYAAGRWSAGMGEVLDTTWAVLTLTKAEVGARPVASAGPDRVVSPGQEVFFDGFASYHPDPKRRIIKYEWDFEGDGLFDAEGVNVSHVYPAEGIFNVNLRVTDDGATCALTARDTAQVTVTGQAVHPPVAEPGGPYTGFAGYDVTLDGSASYDLDAAAGDKIVSYEWDLDGDGNFNDSTDMVVKLKKDVPYTGSIGLRVTDTTGLTDSKRTTLSIVELKMTSSVATDKREYTAHELALIESTVISQSTGATYSDLVLTVKIFDPTGVEVYRENRVIPALVPDQVLKFNIYWNTGSNPAGDYRVAQEVSSLGNILSQPETAFKVLSTPTAGRRGLAGTIQVTPFRVPQRQDATLDYTVTNTGNADTSDIRLIVTVYEPPTGLLQRGGGREQKVIKTWTDDGLVGKAFKVGQRHVGSVVYPNVDLMPDFYMVQLQAVVGVSGPRQAEQGVQVPLASTNLLVVDPFPPVIANPQPPDGTLTRDNRPAISAQVEDEAGGSGLNPASVNLLIDGVKVAHTYTADANPADADRKGTVTYTPVAGLAEGPHAISLDVQDKSGNPAVQVRWGLTVDTRPPTASNLTPADGSDLQTDKPLIAATLGDGAIGSGVDPATIVMKVGDQTVQPTYDAGTGLLSYQPTESLDGGETIVMVTMRDRAGNVAAPVVWKFKTPITVKAELIPEVRPAPTALVWAETQENADLAREAMRDLNIPFRVVAADADVVREMRSGNYNLFVVLDVTQRFHEHFAEELTEYIHQGGGLVITRLAEMDKLRASGMIDLRVKQFLNAGTYPVAISASAMGPAMALTAHGQVQLVTAGKTAQVVGEVGGYPAAILSEAGKGKAVYFCFDLATATTHQNALDLLKNALTYAAPTAPAANSFTGGQAIPMDLTVKNIGKAIQGNLEVILPAEVGLVDRTDGTLTGQTLTWNWPLQKGETKRVRFSLRAPEAIGSFTVKTKLSWLDNLAYRQLAVKDFTFGVTADRPKLGGDIRAALAQMMADPAYGADAARLKAADGIVALLLARNPVTRQEIQADLWESLRAVDQIKLVRRQGAPTRDVRLLLDRLMQLYQARWLAAKS
ncbi:MAG: PKD domain-containing protein [Armatimonadetes bacterium]|nr:PKD domain-containing protein [Armatimonadota bacterium]